MNWNSSVRWGDWNIKLWIHPQNVSCKLRIIRLTKRIFEVVFLLSPFLRIFPYCLSTSIYSDWKVKNWLFIGATNQLVHQNRTHFQWTSMIIIKSFFSRKPLLLLHKTDSECEFPIKNHTTCSLQTNHNILAQQRE